MVTSAGGPGDRDFDRVYFVSESAHNQRDSGFAGLYRLSTGHKFLDRIANSANRLRRSIDFVAGDLDGHGNAAGFDVGRQSKGGK